MQKYVLTILNCSQDLDISFWVSSDKRLKEFDKALDAIPNSGAVLGITLINSAEGYTLLESIISALGGGVGFTLVLIIMSGIREKLDLAQTPVSMRGLPIAFITAALLALAFMGFNGMM